MTLTRETVIQKLDAYANERVTFCPDKHRYTNKEGRRLPSVTTILGIIDKPGLRQWYANVALAAGDPQAPAREATEGARLGTIAHDAIEAWAGGEPWDTYIPDEPEAANSTRAAVQWLAHHNAEILATEIVVCDPAGLYAGKLDAIALIDGKLAVVDWKTNRSGIYAEHLIQSAAYAACVTPALGVSVDETIVVHCCRETGIPSSITRTNDEIEDDFRLFVYALNLYRGLPAVRKAARNAVATIGAAE